MFKNLLTFHSAEIGLLLFFVSFVVIAAWTITRSRREIDDWSSLPLTQMDDANAQELE
jgi:hypothetical protein